MSAYYFKPMMGFYSQFLRADTAWLESPHGRRLMAKTLRFCRSRYGRDEAIKFRDAMVWLGVMPCWLRVERRESHARRLQPTGRTSPQLD